MSSKKTHRLQGILQSVLMYLLCFGLPESGYTAGKITAFDIDAGRWGGPHKIFLSLPPEASPSGSDLSSEDFRLFIDGSAVFPFQLKRRNPERPLHLLILTPFRGFPDTMLGEVHDALDQLSFTKSESTTFRILEFDSREKPVDADNGLQGTGQGGKDLTQFIRLEKLISSNQAFQKTGRKAMIFFVPEMPLEFQEDLAFSRKWGLLLKSRQISPWMLTPSPWNKTFKKRIEELGGGIRVVTPGTVSATLMELRRSLEDEYVLTHDPSWIGNVPYLLTLKQINPPQMLIHGKIDSGRILPQIQVPPSVPVVSTILLLSGLGIIMLWWFRKPQENHSEKPGLTILNPEENFCFIEIPDDCKNLDFLNQIQTKKGLRLSSNLNRVNLVRQQQTFLLEDKNYKNALLINRRRSHRTLLCDKDILDVGELIMIYRNAQAPPAEGRKIYSQNRPVPEKAEKFKGPLKPNTPILVFSGPHQEFPLVRNIITIGSSSMNDLVLNSSEISSRHARISLVGGRWKLQNLSTQEFTMLNGRRIEQRILRDGDEIMIGDAVFIFKTSLENRNFQPVPQKASA